MPVLIVIVVFALAVLALPVTAVCLTVGGSLCVWLFVRGKSLRSEIAEVVYRQDVARFGWGHDLSPMDFEKRCAEALRLSGWKANTTRGSGDQGIDVLAQRDGQVLVVQCKLYGSTVGNKAVQEVIAGQAFVSARHAAVVTNAGFSSSAKELAARTGVHLLHYSELRTINARLGLSLSPLPDLTGEVQILAAKVEANRRLSKKANRTTLAIVSVAIILDLATLEWRLPNTSPIVDNTPSMADSAAVNTHDSPSTAASATPVTAQQPSAKVRQPVRHRSNVGVNSHQ